MKYLRIPVPDHPYATRTTVILLTAAEPGYRWVSCGQPMNLLCALICWLAVLKPILLNQPCRPESSHFCVPNSHHSIYSARSGIPISQNIIVSVL